MKKLFLLLIFALSSMLVCENSVFADANAKRKNKCKSGKYYFAKAKINGPGTRKTDECKKEKDRGWNCQGRYTGLLVNWRTMGEYNQALCGCTDGKTYFVGSQAEANADATVLSEFASKPSSCSGFKAGGEIYNIENSFNSAFEGNVANSVSTGNIIFDYDNNAIILQSLRGYIEVNSEDFDNEYSTFIIKISRIIEDKNGSETEVTLYEVKASIMNGEFSITGDKEGLNESDFSITTLEYGKKYEIITEEKTIPLTTDIDEDMDLEVSFAGDVGNIRHGVTPGFENDHNPFVVVVFPTVVLERISIMVRSDKAQQVLVDIRRMNGTIEKQLGTLNLMENTRTYFDADVSTLQKGTYFVTLTESDGITHTNKIIKQ